MEATIESAQAGRPPVVPAQQTPAVTRATDSDAVAWDAYVNAHEDATCDHLWLWRDVIHDVFGHESVHLIARQQGAVTGVLPLVRFESRLFGRFLVSMPFLNYGGLLVSDETTRAALLVETMREADAFGASHVELRHAARQTDNLPFRQHKVGARMVLPASIDSLWDSIDRKVRNQVRKAQKEGLTAVVGGFELVDEFYDVFARNMRDLGTPVYTRRLFIASVRALGDAARVTVVRRGPMAMAASITIRFRETVLVPWASSLRQFRQLCPNMLLYWTMLEHAVMDGAKRFDFGRSSADAGTLPFKRQWGAAVTPLHWEYLLRTRATIPDQGTSNRKMALAVNAWTHLPLWLANLAGPTIVRNIP